MKDNGEETYRIPAFILKGKGQSGQDYRLLVVGCLREECEKPVPQGDDCVLKIKEIEVGMDGHVGHSGTRTMSATSVAQPPIHWMTSWLTINAKEDLPSALQQDPFLAKYAGSSSLSYKVGTSTPAVFLFTTVEDQRDWLIHTISGNEMGGIVEYSPPDRP
jgi:hypothetical protein